jgi:hypothetical protein
MSYFYKLWRKNGNLCALAHLLPTEKIEEKEVSYLVVL